MLLLVGFKESHQFEHFGLMLLFECGSLSEGPLLKLGEMGLKERFFFCVVSFDLEYNVFALLEMG